MAEEPPNRPSPQPRRSWWITAALLALLLVVGLLVALWIKAPALYGRGDAAKTAAATTRGAILTVGAALIAATAAGAGLYMTARTIRINQQALAETQRANREADQREREAQVTDRYTRAIGQLGDPQLAIRLGGIYALEQIAIDSDRDRRTIVEVLSAFIRTSSRSPDNRSNAHPEEQPASAASPAGDTRQSLPTDVQAAVTVLGRLPSQKGVSRGDLTGAWLSGADLTEANLSRAVLTGADLSRDLLAEADLIRALFAGADLPAGADLTRDLPAETDLIRTLLGGADLSGAVLAGVNLSRAVLTGADLTYALLAGADLTGARLAGADLTDAYLGGVHLAGAKNLTQQQVESARGDDQTKLPAGLRRPAHWSAGPAVSPATDG